MAEVGLRVARVRRADARALTRGLVWVEAYLPLDPAAFAAFEVLRASLGSAVAAAASDPELARRALTPIDSHGEAMLAADVEKLAHRFVLQSRKMDLQHSEEASPALAVVESFVNGPEVASPHFWPGAWVVVFEVAPGSPEWKGIESGALNAVSFQADVRKIAVHAGGSTP